MAEGTQGVSIPPPKRRRASRYVLVILGLLVLIGGLVAIKFAQISTLIHFGEKAKAAGTPPETVATKRAEEQSWEGSLSAVGSVASAKGVAVSNESPGTVTRIAFESGEMVKEGQILVELDTSVERAQLASQQARAELMKIREKRTRKLVESGAISQSELDSDLSALKAATNEASAIQAQIGRKTVRAPFAGKLGIRAINLGQFLNSGTPITSLEAIDTVYVDFTLPQQRLPETKVGMPVRIVVAGADAKAAGASDKPVDGTIAAVDPTIDTATRTIKVRATVPNKGEALRPGMFVEVSVVLPDHGKVVVVPGPAVVHAPYGDSVFVVEDKKADSPGMTKTPDGKVVRTARQQFVRVGEARGDFIELVEGIKPGQEIVTAGAFKLRNGSPVVVDDSPDAGGPPPELNPHPKNR